jgi:uncharacterized YigZ family protein
MKPYSIPFEEARREITVVNSRFIACLAPAFSVEQARHFIHRIKTEYPEATHHVPAFIIGHGDSQTSHCSDDGEPSGTAGRPALAVLSGSGLGDVVVVVTRFFGGTKLGTGGLVRAYGDAVREVLAITRRARKLQTTTFRISVPYGWFERLRNLLVSHAANLLDQQFAEEVTMAARLPTDLLAGFESELSDLSPGSIFTVFLSVEETIVPDL